MGSFMIKLLAEIISTIIAGRYYLVIFVKGMDE